MYSDSSFKPTLLAATQKERLQNLLAALLIEND